MTADNDRIFEKVFLSHPDQTKRFCSLLCPSWTACVPYNIYLNTKRLAPLLLFPQNNNTVMYKQFICLSVVRISLVSVMGTFLSE